MSKRRKERAMTPPKEEKPVNWSRLHQLFSNMRSRRTKLFENHVLSPVVVEAKTPEEAEANTNQALVEKASKGGSN